MKYVTFAEVRRKAQAIAGPVRVASGLDSAKDQPHDEAHWQALYRLDAARLARLLADGTWEFTGPRRMRWNHRDLPVNEPGDDPR